MGRGALGDHVAWGVLKNTVVEHDQKFIGWL